MNYDKLPNHNADTVFETSLVYKYKVSKRSSLIYSMSLLFLLAALASLPFIYIYINIKSEGIIQPLDERTDILAPVTGRVAHVDMIDNQKVVIGQTLLTIDASLPNQESSFLAEKQKRIIEMVADLKKMVQCSMSNSNEAVLSRLNTAQYTASWQQYVQELTKANIEKVQTEKIFNRYAILFEKHVLTSAEYEKYKYDYDQAQSSLILIKKKYESQWQIDISQNYSDLRQIKGSLNTLQENKKLYTVKAVINGSLQSLGGVRPGMYIFSNQKIAEISPDSRVIAFVYVKPSDIGLIYKGQKVEFQIDAFNYNQWGLISGKVLDISDDIVLSSGNKPLFKVKCALEKNQLKLKNGYQGNLKKGMSVIAHFTIAKRNLYELLYDKIDDWINPNANLN